MFKVINLATGAEQHFTNTVDAKYAVAYCYCEANNLLSWLFSHLHDNTLEEAYKRLSFTIGKRSIACDDFATMLKA